MVQVDVRNVAILLLLGFVLWLAIDPPAQALPDGGGGDADRNVIAVTGMYGSNASVLYLFDTKNRHLTVYRADNGRRLEMVAARDCTYDFFIETYNDSSARELLPRALKRGLESFYKGGGKYPAFQPPSEQERGPNITPVGEPQQPQPAGDEPNKGK